MLYIMKTFYSIISSFLIVFISFSQETELEVRKMIRTASEQELVIENSRYIQEGYLYFADLISNRLIEINPESSNYNYRKGYIVLNLKKNGIDAIPFLEKAVQHTDKNYDMVSIDEKDASIDAFYYLGKAYHIDGQIQKAIENYNIFLSQTQKNSEIIEDVNLSLKQCEVALKLLELPKKSKIINLGDTLNSSFPEYSPFISIDGSALFFTSRRPWDEHSKAQFKDPITSDFKEDIYVSYNDEAGKWSKPKRLDFCEDDRNEASISVSPDERRVYLYQDDKGNGDIFYTDLNGNTFDEIKDLKYGGVNSKYWETHCTMTIDGLNMYFVSARPEGLGGRDIYRVVKLPNGEWSLPQNLGPTINTPYDEDCPFIAADNKTLYYSSNGPKSMGGFDVFMTMRDEDNNWQTPINVGFPINSTSDDVFYTTTIDGLKGYITSNRKGGKGEKDLYEIQNDYLGATKISLFKGRVKTVNNKQIPSDLEIVLKNLSFPDYPFKLINPRLRDGGFFSSLDECSDYEYILKSKTTGKEFYKGTFSTDCEGRYIQIYREILLNVDKLKIIPNIAYSLKGSVYDKKTNEKLDSSKIAIYISNNSKVIDTITTDLNGAFASNFFKTNNYYFGDTLHLTIKVSQNGYINQSFDVKQVLDSTAVIDLKYYLEKNEVGVDLAKVVNLKPIYFDLGKFAIRPDAKKELDKIVRIMKDNPTIHVELGSHTDCRSSSESNMILSDKRAKASADYIKKRIDNPIRISGKGYGETQLVNQCECEGKVIVPCTEAQHQQNRRTEFKIVQN